MVDYTQIDDTIVAPASGTGTAARTILRLSGPGAFPLVESLLKSEDRSPFSRLSTWRQLPVRIPLEKSIDCPARLYKFAHPRSYTGQDLAELHLPGSPALVRFLLERILSAGARMALPGEFTARAFLNGRMDLTEAEAVAAVISARSDGELRAGQRLLEGALHRHCAAIAGRIAHALAQVEAQLDFSTEDIELARPAELQAQLGQAAQELERLIRESVSWERLAALPQVLAGGLPNAGKSALVNALLDSQRSIVSPTSGTTRDLVTAPLRLSRGECLLIDSAGLERLPIAACGSRMQESHRATHSEAENTLKALMQDQAQRGVAQCDLLLWVIDMTDGPRASLDFMKKFPEKKPVLIAGNKLDLVSDDLVEKIRAVLPPQLPFLPVSARTRENIPALRGWIEKLLAGELYDALGGGLALTIRQHQSLAQAGAALALARDRLGRGKPLELELLALELRETLDHLGNISGAIVSDEILGRIFQSFCIGK